MQNYTLKSISLSCMLASLVMLATAGSAYSESPAPESTPYLERAELFVQEKALFIKKFWQNHTEIGAIAPSSSFLAHAMTKHLSSYTSPLLLLEVGAGTGVFTEYIVQSMPVGSVLHVVEIDQEFCKMLEEKFKGNPNVHIHCCSILDLTLPGKADCIISGLPFNAFPASFVEQILKKYADEFIKPSGTITFFEYAFFPTLKKLLVTEYAEVFAALQNFKKQQASTEESIVMLNIPPARVITCVANGSTIVPAAA